MVKRLVQALIIAGVTCLLLVVIEVAVRLSGAAEGCSVSAGKLWVCDPILGFRVDLALAPHGETFNRAGFRTREFAPKRPGTYRILSLGDSCTMGLLGMGFVREPYPQRLERMVAERGWSRPLEVLNAGVVGYNTQHALLLLQTKLRGLEPDLVTVRYGWNDFLMSAAIGLLGHGLPAPVQEALLRSSAYTFLQRVRLETLLRRSTARERGLAFLAEQPEWQPSVPLEQYRSNLRRIVSIARERGAEVWLLTAPINPRPDPVALERFASMNRLSPTRLRELLASYNDVVREVGAELRAPVVDMVELYRAREGEPLFHDIAHPGPGGHDLEAEELYRRLVASTGG